MSAFLLSAIDAFFLQTESIVAKKQKVLLQKNNP